MGTQKTGMGGGENNTPSNDDLNNTPSNDDLVDIGGRKLKPVDMRKEVGQAFRDMHPENYEEGNPMKPPAPEPDPEAKAEVDRLLPEFIREEEQVRSEDSGSNVQSAVDEKDVEAANLLSQQVVEARKRGDYDTARAIEDVLSKMVDKVPKRVRAKKDVHPALKKLRRNLGLQKIKPATVEWGGSKWHFAAPPPAVDHWIAKMVQNELGTFSSLKVAGALVGIDEAPLYEVFNVDLVAEFSADNDPEPVRVRIYEKRCDACGEVNDVNAQQCTQCDSVLDPFDVPLELRLQCVDLVHKFFMSEFGPVEELRDLHLKMREIMPDRIDSKEDLYPFLSTSESYSATPEEMESIPTRQSGEKR